MNRPERGVACVVQPEEGKSFWQPVPANGYAEVQISRRNVASNDRLLAFMTPPPACHGHGHHRPCRGPCSNT